MYLLVPIQLEPSEEVRERRGDAFLFYISVCYSVAFLAQLKQLRGGKFYLSSMSMSMVDHGREGTVLYVSRLQQWELAHIW